MIKLLYCGVNKLILKRKYMILIIEWAMVKIIIKIIKLWTI